MSAQPKAEAAEARIHAGDADADGSGSAAPFDLLLSDATRNPLRRFLPGMAGVRFGAHLVRRPDRVVRRGAGLVGELAKVGIGKS